MHPLQTFFECCGFECQSYSGRAMYGKRCLAVVPDATEGGFIADCVEQACRAPDECTSEVIKALRTLRTDSMGLGEVYYFPGIPYTEGAE